MPDSRPLVALTAGEPAGIGPDLCLIAATQHRDQALVCIADRDLLAARALQLGIHCTLLPYSPGAAVSDAAGTLSVLHLPLAATCIAGQLNVANAPTVLEWINRAVDGCLGGEFAAMVTAPVQKSLINEAGIAFRGHTEYIAARTGAPRPVMMLAAPGLRVALATTHLPLRAVSDALSIDMLLQILRILAADLTRFWGITAPRIAVCGLNPHAGEGGHLGDEEQIIIAPAIQQARAQGLSIQGPMPADTLFVPRNLAGFDAVLAMYHDQGLPVLKHVGFGHAVNITLGLSIVRTSVDHGTALDLAGSARADEGSLIAAIAAANAMISRRG